MRKVWACRISVHGPSPDTIWAWAASGRCALGRARPRSGYLAVEAELFLTLAAVCALPRRHALSAKRAVTARGRAGLPLIAGGSGSVQPAVEGAFAAAGVTPHCALMAEYTAARCGLVAQGLGIAIVDPVPARELTGLPIVLRPFRPEAPIETVLLRPAGRPTSRLAEQLIVHLKAERDARVDG
jgi:hypothetical protein